MPNPEATAHYRTCNICEAMCGIEINYHEDAILSIKGDKRDVFSKGFICPKATALQDLHEDKDRIRTPLRRTANGWEEISWEMALKETADTLNFIQERYGRDAVGIYLGNPTAHNHGAMLTLPLLLSTLKTRNRFSATSVDQLPHMLACYKMFGHQALFPIPDIDRTDYFLCLGGNPVASGGSIFSAPGFKDKIKALHERGGKFILIDPRKTETAAIADQHLFIRPGSDVYLLASLINVCFEKGFANLKHLTAYTEGFETLEHAVAAFTPEAVEQHTNISANTIRNLACDFAHAKKAAAYGRMGVSTQAHSTVASWLVYALNVITGNIDHPGGLMFPRPPIDLVGMTALMDEAGSFASYHSRVSGYPEFSGEFPAVCMAEEILMPGPGKIHALITHAGNPVISTPNGTQLEQALGKLDFMVAIDFYVNETTRHATIILPPSGPLEHGHYDIAMSMGAIQNFAKYSSALFPKPADSKHDWEIIAELTSLLASKNLASSIAAQLTLRVLKSIGDEGMLDFLLRAGPYGSGANIALHIDQVLMHNGVSQLAWKPVKKLFKQVIERFTRLASLIPSDLHQPETALTLEELKKHPHGIDLGPLQPCLPDRLFTHNKRIRLADELFITELLKLAPTLSDAPNTSLLLIGRRHVRSNNSWLHNAKRLVKGKERCTVMLNPIDAKAHNIEDTHLVRVSTLVGSIELPAEITDQIMPGVVSIPHGWGHHRQGIRLEVAASHAGVSLNDITDDKMVDAITGMAVLNGIPVTIAPAH